MCWGGHSISREEYDYTKQVGYQLGLRAFDICTGCGPGAMKGPMKGATIAHAKQRRRDNRYIGITEPGIIAAESPNPIVNNLVIMPDIEKRLEAFVRIGHGIIVFPGGVGTAEEILYLLGILLHPDNAGIPFPLIFTGPRESAAYFEQIDRFLRLALGDDGGRGTTRSSSTIRAAVARTMVKGIDKVRTTGSTTRMRSSSTGRCRYPLAFQMPFQPTHEAMARACSSIATGRCTNSRRICAARSPASSPATSRKRACGRSSSTVRSRSTATPTSCARWMSCCRHSSCSTA